MNDDDFRQLWGKLVAQSWDDEALAARLRSEPSTVLREHGVSLPDDVTVQVFEDDGNTVLLPLAAPPSAQPEMSNEQLDQVSGGLTIPLTSFWLRSRTSFGSYATIVKVVTIKA